jgi:hypothetical protein
VITVATLLALLILKVWKADRKLILDAILIVLVTYVGLSHFNRYYTIWVVPFLTMDLAINWDCTRKYLSRVLYLLFFLSAFTYNSIYWWFNSLLFIHEFTPQIGEMSRFICAVGRNLRLGDLASTFSQSILAGICIIYGAMVTMRNTLAGQ